MVLYFAFIAISKTGISYTKIVLNYRYLSLFLLYLNLKEEP